MEDSSTNDRRDIEMEEQEGKVREINSETQSKKMKMIGCGVISGLLLVVLVIVFIVIFLFPSGVDVCQNKDDGFAYTFYKNASGHRIGMQYKFHSTIQSKDKKPSLSYNTRDNAVQACADSSATLWEVSGAKEEWDHFYDIILSQKVIDSTGTGLWINGLYDQQCPESSQSDDPTECVADEAESGRGLKVIWPSTGQKSTYSRLTGRESDSNCFFLQHGKTVWIPASCEDEYYSLCIRRQCNEENN